MEKEYVSHSEWMRRNLFENGNTHNVIERDGKYYDKNNQKQELEDVRGKYYFKKGR